MLRLGAGRFVNHLLELFHFFLGVLRLDGANQLLVGHRGRDLVGFGLFQPRRKGSATKPEHAEHRAGVIAFGDGGTLETDFVQGALEHQRHLARRHGDALEIDFPKGLKRVDRCGLEGVVGGRHVENEEVQPFDGEDQLPLAFELEIVGRRGRTQDDGT